MTSRRQRNKREGTFLEDVRESLRLLAREITEVKLLVMKLQDSQTVLHTGNYADRANNASWNAWQPWLDLGFEETYACVPTFAFVEEAMDSTPQVQVASISRTSLLTYRHLAPQLKYEDALLTVVPDYACVVCKTWAPTSKDIFIDQSALRDELECEAASIIQRFYRNKYKDRPSSDISDPYDSNDDALDPGSLVVVMLSPSEFRRQLLPAMDVKSVLANYSDGIQDFDAGFWYRFAIESARSDSDGNDMEDGSVDGNVDDDANENMWDQQEIAEWIQRVFRQLQDIRSSQGRADHVHRNWSQAIHHVSPNIRAPLWKMLEEALEKQKESLKD